MLLYINYMLQREWRTWKLLVYCTFIPIFIVRFFPMSQFWAETVFCVSLMFFLLTAIHGFQMIYLMNRSPGPSKELTEALSNIYDMEME